MVKYSTARVAWYSLCSFVEGGKEGERTTVY